MHTQQEIERKFWKALKTERTALLGLDAEDGGMRPMTALTEGDRAPIWFFASRDSALVRRLGTAGRAFLAFSAREHDLFAAVQGTLALDDNRSVIEHFWNPFVAAWFAGGKDDPRLALLRFDAEHAQVWLNAATVLEGVKFLAGGHPKREYQDHVARLDLR